MAVPDTEDIDLEHQYLKGNLIGLKKTMVSYCDELLDKIDANVRLKKGFSVVRASDGEAYFLQKRAVGNITRRHYTKSTDLDSLDVSPFRQGLLDSDIRLGDMYKNNRRMFRKIYGREIFSDIPFESVYALFASKRIFRTFWRLGIIGSDHKIDIIKKLFEHAEYRDYIGRQGIDHYIGVPERGAANDPYGIAERISGQIREDIDVYLVGIGIVKLFVIPRMKNFHSNVFLDAGAGISAMAGMVGRERAYFAGWKNFQLNGYDYSQVDTMDLDAQGGIIVKI